MSEQKAPPFSFPLVDEAGRISRQWTSWFAANDRAELAVAAQQTANTAVTAAATADAKAVAAQADVDAIETLLAAVTAITGTYSGTAGGAYDQTILQTLMDEVTSLRADLVQLSTEVKLVP